MAHKRTVSYTRMQIALHWLVAALVLAQYATSGAIVRTHQVHLIGQKPSSTDLLLHVVHNRVGLAIVALMLGRLVLRFWVGTPEPQHASGPARRLAQWVHFAFYGVLVAQGITGAIASYFWWPISTVHVLLFKLLLALITVHVAAALWHTFVRKDGVMSRIGFRALVGDRQNI